LPSAVVFGVLAALLALLPVGGAALVWVPGVVALAADSQWGWAIFLSVWGTAVSVSDNLLRPLLISTQVPVSTLVALAEQSNEARVLAALDARMGEAYLAAYSRNGADWDEVIAPRLAGPVELPALPGRRWVATGSGFARHAWLRDAYRESVEMRYEGDLPRAGAIARIAARRLGRGAGVPAEQAAPLYLRDKVALTSEERRRS
jgi:hypothetical protein